MLTVNLRVLLSLSDSGFTSFGYIPSGGITRSYCSFNFLKNLHTGVCSGCTIKKKILMPTVCKSFNFSTSLPTCYLLFFASGHPNRYEVICHWAFDCIFLMSDVDHQFIYPLDHTKFEYGKCL